MRHGLIAAAALLASGPLAAEVRGRSDRNPAPPPAPYAGAYQPRGVDEIGLWREDDEQERALAQSPLVIRDAALDAYVRRVLCAAVGAERCGAVRTYVVRVPVFNATMSPNGTLRVYSGLLLRTRSEAELAAVLGHEFGHFERRHTLSAFKAQRSGTDALSWAALLASMNGTRQAVQGFGEVRSAVLGQLAHYSREQEREADLIGLGYLNRSALRPGAASRVWRSLILEQEASAAARGLRKPAFHHTPFFASHPASGRRAEYLYSLALPDGDGREEGEAGHAAALSPWLTTFLDDQIKLSDFGASDYLIGHLAETGWTAALWRARGDLFRARGAPRDLMNAADFYVRAVALDPQLAEAQRGLGLSLMKTGRVEEGAAALRRYRALRPDASDGAMIDAVLSPPGGRP